MSRENTYAYDQDGQPLYEGDSVEYCNTAPIMSVREHGTVVKNNGEYWIKVGSYYEAKLEPGKKTYYVVKELNNE